MNSLNCAINLLGEEVKSLVENWPIVPSRPLGFGRMGLSLGFRVFGRGFGLP